jgi:8-oxo-dGTP diphosphatase
MSRSYCPICSVLGFILSPDRQSVLMVHRIARGEARDENHGKYNGLGGHVERDEDLAHALIREIKEEADLDVTHMTFRGSVNWTGFGRNGEDWMGFIFIVDGFTGTPLAANDEGPLEWVPIDRIPTLPMWEGDRYFLPLVFDSDPRPFHALLPYDHGRPVSFSMTRL